MKDWERFLLWVSSTEYLPRSDLQEAWMAGLEEGKQAGRATEAKRLAGLEWKLDRLGEAIQTLLASLESPNA